MGVGGEGCKPNLVEAVACFERAARAVPPVPDAVYSLAQCVHLGRGVVADRKRAMELYRQAMALGVSQARDAIRDLNEAPRDASASASAYASAANSSSRLHGDENDAVWVAAEDMRLGRNGVPRDLKQSLTLFQAAAQKGSARAFVSLQLHPLRMFLPPTLFLNMPLAVGHTGDSAR